MLLPMFIDWVALTKKGWLPILHFLKKIIQRLAPLMSLPAVGVIVGFLSFNVSAQNYPSKTIRILAAEVGGGADTVARIIAQGLSVSLGQPVIVDNRGGSATIPAMALAQAAADGYTFLVYGNNLWILPLIQNTPYDPIKDFAPITLVANSPNIIVAHPSLPVKSVKDLISLARAKPGVLNYGTAATGGASHLAAELFNAMANVKLVRIPYKGTMAALNDLMGGQLHVMFGTVGTVMGLVHSSRLRAIAVTSPKPSPLVPDLPTVNDSGLSGYEIESAYGFWAPVATVASILNRIQTDTVHHLLQAETREHLFKTGVVVVANSPSQFTMSMKNDMTRMGKVIQTAGIRIN